MGVDLKLFVGDPIRGNDAVVQGRYAGPFAGKLGGDPLKDFRGRCGLTRIVRSDCPSMSMKPGATTRPAASMVSAALARISDPIAAIRPSLMATSPLYQGDPVPSMMCPC